MTKEALLRLLEIQKSLLAITGELQEPKFGELSEITEVIRSTNEVVEDLICRLDVRDYL